MSTIDATAMIATPGGTAKDRKLRKTVVSGIGTSDSFKLYEKYDTLTMFRRVKNIQEYDIYISGVTRVLRPGA